MIQNKQTIFLVYIFMPKSIFEKQKQIANLQNQYALSNHYPTHFQPPAEVITKILFSPFFG